MVFLVDLHIGLLTFLSNLCSPHRLLKLARGKFVFFINLRKQIFSLKLCLFDSSDEISHALVLPSDEIQL